MPPKVDKLKNLKIKLESTVQQLSRFDTFLNSVSSKDDLFELNLRLEHTEPLLSELSKVQSEIDILEIGSGATQLDEASDEPDPRETSENLYFRVLSRAKLLAKKFKSDTDEQNVKCESPNNNVSIKLPKLEIPTFSGEISEWLNFYNTFISLIDKNTQLDDIQKLQYLKTALKGEASNIINDLAINGENYKIALQLLQDRYNNKRIIVNNHLKAIFQLPNISKDSTATLRQFIDTLHSNIKALDSLKLPVSSWYTVLIHLITSKFDFITNREWEMSLNGNRELPSFEQMKKFLLNRLQLLETLESQKPHNKPTFRPKIAPQRSANVATNKQQYQTTCPMCKSNHFIYTCREFTKLSKSQRIIQINRLKLCVNCLKPHNVSQCTSTSTCKICQQKHNTLLHLDNSNNNNNTNAESQTTTSLTTSNKKLKNCKVLLSTAAVYIKDTFGNYHICRALLDGGSESHFITSALCQRLQLSTMPTRVQISGINPTDSSSTMASTKVTISIKSRLNSFCTELDCLVLDKITRETPSFTFSRNIVKIPDNIILADPKFNETQPIDLLIGIEKFWQLILAGTIKLSADQPDFRETQFGWVIGGKLEIPERTHHISCNLNKCSVDSQLTKFWQIEEVSETPITHLSQEEQNCEQHFVDNYERNADGRFVVKLPFKPNKLELGNSLNNATAKFYSLEKRLQKSPELYHDYQTFMKEYQLLGHMVQINACDSTNETFYLPHHGVVKETSVSTKMRVVFNASAKSSNGISLNDNLMVGPTIQLDLFSILLRFRAHQIAFTADIAKMYRQILVHSDDQNYQRILWRDNPSKKLETFRLNTVTYGTACAPFLAVRCLYQLSVDNQSKFPHAASTIKNDFYMDDLLTGASSIEEAISLRDQLIHVLREGGFNLCKFASNKSDLLLNSDDSQSDIILNLDREQNARTLGLVWNSQHDVFKFIFQEPISHSHLLTKRTLLSQISLIFDPLGLINPVIVLAKLIMQKLWTLNLKWDDPIPHDLSAKWLQLKKQLTELNSFNIPRKVVGDHTATYAEIHGFCDASQVAYGACIYVRTLDNKNNWCVKLLTAKSRVAPLKTISIPRLELCSAQLLAKLVHKICAIINIEINKIYLWSDSTIVLAWLKHEPSNLKTFVANRVSEIQSLTSKAKWFHVPSELNPADVLSRGMLPNELKESQLWWIGPQFLKLDQSCWRTDPQTHILELPETKIALTANTDNNVTSCEMLLAYSSFKKLTRIIALILRFKNNTLNKQNKIHGPLQFQEIERATEKIIKLVQLQSFSNEINQLSKSNSIDKRSKLLPLNPFLDDKGLIRVGGRLKNSNLLETHKHPLVIPKNHHITKIIISDYHINLKHGGNQLTLAMIRQKFWPLSGRDAVRSVLRKCVTCFRVKPISYDQIMGNLPKARVEPSKPFQNCAIDYGGPINIKNGFGKTKKSIKSYIALFICLATRAIHIELVCDCTTETFLSALRRMTARRGKVLNMFSDNATNFVGADNELKKLFTSTSFKENIVSSLENENIHWHFIPSRSPHMGGLWEAGIKAAKYHIKRVTKNASLTYDQFYTLLTEIEACLNSRPLSVMSNDPNDLSPLTPGHFLIGSPLLSLPEENFSDTPTNRLSHWERISQLKQHFWQRWSTDYLHELQQRNKWRTSSKQQFTPGALVVLKEDNLPPLAWKMGRLQETHPGSDGIIRVVSVKTSNNNVVKRAVNKVCVLPVE